MTVGISHGADAEALRSLAVALAATADHLEQVDLRTVDGVDGLGWTGQDARTFRATWDETHAVTLHLTAALMRRGAAQLLEEAADQDEASGGASGWTALRDRVHARVDALGEVFSQTVAQLGMLGTAVSLAELGDLRRRAGQAMDAAGASGALGGFLDRSIGTGTGSVLGVLGAIGTANDLHGAYHGYRDGDGWQAVNGTVSGGLGVAGMVTSSPWVAGPAVSWSAGSAIGDDLRERMEGTAFGDRFTDRMDAVFDVMGPAGMLVTPGALAVAAGEAVVDAVSEAVLDLTDGPDDPLLGGGGR
ncbi:MULTISPECIES: hypothetical protein [unclassified Actinotalea]|uniref:hypothetical protein n=1 Tax=unclassified Actinotalea TaxID=2638618 RepID=UPI0015F3CEA2|nr:MULTISPECIES: hypothetical protein [unclassified Actinotalea]